jgi:DNA helicase-2/ATP-dependent DNA helicase PcrA
MEHVERAATQAGVSLPAAARTLPGELTPRARVAFGRFFDLFEELRKLLEVRSPGEVVKAVLERSGLAAQYASGDEEDRTRRANQDQLVAAATEAAERGLDLASFLDEAALLSDADARSDTVPVQLSTLHAAKGLEFDTVLLVGLEDGLLPLRREGAIEDLEEERRLAYVGMTRARSRLVLTCARQRLVNGQRLSGMPSPFLAEIPVEILAAGGLGRPSRGQTARQSFMAPQPVTMGPAQRPEPAPPRSVRSSHPDGWRPGLKVQHATFGRGVVLQVQGSGAQTRLVIYFDRAGRKTLLPSIAQLERA